MIIITHRLYSIEVTYIPIWLTRYCLSYVQNSKSRFQNVHLDSYSESLIKQSIVELAVWFKLFC